MTITQEYVDEQRQKAFGNTVYRCVFCGWQGFGAPVTMHGMRREPGVWGYVHDHRHRCEPLEAFVGTDVEKFAS
jgi:hypothetical protein